MTFRVDFLTLVAFLGTFQGLVFAVVFWNKNRSISNKLFSLLLLATSIRIAKNIFVHLQYLNPGIIPNELWQISVNAGISHQFAIGPLLHFYFLSKLKSKFTWNNLHLLHFTPYTLLLISTPFLTWNFWKDGGLWLSYISILLYFLLSVKSFYKYKSIVDKGVLIWLKGVLIVITILLLAYSPALFKYIGYIGGAILYSVAIIIVGYFMLDNKGAISFFRTKYGTSSLSNDKVIEIKTLVDSVMIKDRPYLDPELTMQSLADKISVSSHHISRVINQEFSMSFTDYINSFRLEEATSRLKNSDYDHLKISALAFDSGFNSVPTFNTLFKKVKKVTPSEFRTNLRNQKLQL